MQSSRESRSGKDKKEQGRRGMGMAPNESKRKILAFQEKVRKGKKNV